MLASEGRERTKSELSGEPVLEYHRRVILAATNKQDLANTQFCLLNLVVSGKLTRAQVAELYQLITQRVAQLQAGVGGSQANSSSVIRW